MTACYDFAEVVIHVIDRTCPRYNGGRCRPLPGRLAPDDVRASALSMTVALHDQVLFAALDIRVLPGHREESLPPLRDTES